MDIQELAIAVTAKNLNPTILSLDFLKSSGIVPSDWQLSKQPVLNPAQSRLSFQNGLNIVAQPRNITFVEALRTDSQEQQMQAPGVVQKYVEKLPYADYQGINIAPKSIVTFPDPSNTPQAYLTETLLAPGPWRDVGNAPVRAAISFVYQLDRCQLNLSLSEVQLRQQDREQVVPAILFSGSFNYSVATLAESARVTTIQERANAWAADLETFRETVHQKFLGKAKDSIFPPGIMPS